MLLLRLGRPLCHTWPLSATVVVQQLAGNLLSRAVFMGVAHCQARVLLCVGGS